MNYALSRSRGVATALRRAGFQQAQAGEHSKRAARHEASLPALVLPALRAVAGEVRTSHSFTPSRQAGAGPVGKGDESRDAV